MSIISYAEAEAFIDDELSAGNLDFPLLCDAADAWVKAYCRRDFESATYTEYYNGHGLPDLCLDQYPVTDLTRLSVSRRSALRVCNTNTLTTASATVTSTGVVLTYNGTASTFLFADYATLTLLQAAINATSGWSAELQNSAEAAMLSTELCKAYGKSCINSQYVDLEVPDVAEYDFTLDTDSGILTRPVGFPAGLANIRVDYTAGYAADDMPEDIKTAVKILVKDWWEKRSESAFNLANYSVGGMAKQIISVIPPEARMILDAYRRMRV